MPGMPGRHGTLVSNIYAFCGKAGVVLLTSLGVGRHVRLGLSRRGGVYSSDRRDSPTQEPQRSEPVVSPFSIRFSVSP